jgi:hypothetical protein
MPSLARHDFRCTSCDAVIAGPVTFHVGLPFCCAGCVAGGPCSCSYDVEPCMPADSVGPAPRLAVGSLRGLPEQGSAWRGEGETSSDLRTTEPGPNGGAAARGAAAPPAMAVGAAAGGHD